MSPNPPLPPSQTERSFSLRPALPKDASAIGSLGAHIFETTFGYSMPPTDLTQYLLDAYSTAAILEDLSSAHVTLIVACDPSDAVIGFSQLRRDSTEPCIVGKARPVELQRLYLHPDHHGKGVARVLYEDAERIAREEGFQTMWLGVWEENFKAQGVYKKFGFERCGEHDFVMGSCVQTDWIMCKKL